MTASAHQPRAYYDSTAPPRAVPTGSPTARTYVQISTQSKHATAGKVAPALGRLRQTLTSCAALWALQLACRLEYVGEGAAAALIAMCRPGLRRQRGETVRHGKEIPALYDRK